MNDKDKNRLFVTLIFLIPAMLTGPLGLGVWLSIQFNIWRKEKKEKVPLTKRPDIIEMNKPENLTEQEKMMSNNGKFIKIKEGSFVSKEFLERK